MVKVKDLKNQTGMEGGRPILHCKVCGQECSANESDHFTAYSDYVFKCCDEPMLLVIKHTVYIEIEVQND